MTNYDKWLAYTDGLSSPNSFRKWGWIYLIGASLQRRVWLSANHLRCFPNMYIILVGNPGVGKGLVIREVSSFLSHWKLGDVKFDQNKVMSKEQKEMANMTVETDIMEAQKKELQSSSKGDIVRPSLYPLAADATTYEALVQELAQSYRRINYIDFDAKQQKNVPRIYGHSSLCFALQELASLLRKRTNDTVNLLLAVYDCPEDYVYDTKTQGKDRMRRACINLLGGTTPSFMQSTFDDKLVDEGLSSRTFYIFARKNRKNQFFVPSHTPEQEVHKIELLEHVKNLSTLYGAVQVSDETMQKLQNWWDDTEKNKHLRANKSIKMVPYYARKNIHVMKVAMAIHFGETFEMSIPWETFEKAIGILEEEEKTMHLALCLEGNTPMGKAIRRVLDYLENGEKTVIDIATEVCPSILSSMKEMEECLSFLIDTNQITTFSKRDEEFDTNLVYYKMK